MFVLHLFAHLKLHYTVMVVYFTRLLLCYLSRTEDLLLFIHTVIIVINRRRNKSYTYVHKHDIILLWSFCWNLNISIAKKWYSYLTMVYELFHRRFSISTIYRHYIISGENRIMVWIIVSPARVKTFWNRFTPSVLSVRTRTWSSRAIILLKILKLFHSVPK